MTVQELIEHLKLFPLDQQVCGYDAIHDCESMGILVEEITEPATGRPMVRIEVEPVELMAEG